MKLAVLFVAVCLALAEGAWRADPPYYAQRYVTDIGRTRGLWVDPAGDLLVISQTGGQHIVAIFEEMNGDGSVDVVTQVLVGGQGLRLDHGIAYNNGYLYASSNTNVYRWPYTPGSRTQITVNEEMVIEGIPAPGHGSRTLTFDPEGRLYVSVGSDANVDNNSDRARIRRFSLPGNLPYQFDTGLVFADGLRNEVGLAWDLNGVLHGVENGADQLNRPDIGGDIHQGNPAEEMNRFNRTVGTHYGYPYCFSTYNLDNYEAGTQFAWPSFMGDGTHDDNFCKNLNNNQAPLLAMPAHSAPLGFDFFRGEPQKCGSGEGAFPCNMKGDAFVAFHGSWNSNPPAGYRVARFPFDSSTNEPTREDINVLYEDNIPSSGGNCPGCIRPVQAVFNNNGHLFVSEDSNFPGVFKVTYGTPPRPIRKHVFHK